MYKTEQTSRMRENCNWSKPSPFHWEFRATSSIWLGLFNDSSLYLSANIGLSRKTENQTLSQPTFVRSSTQANRALQNTKPVPKTLRHSSQTKPCLPHVCITATFLSLLVHGLSVMCTLSSQISNLKQLHVYCGRPDILITRTYGEYLVHQAVAGLTGADSGPPEPSLVFSGDDINLNTAYFFMPTYVTSS